MLAVSSCSSDEAPLPAPSSAAGAGTTGAGAGGADNVPDSPADSAGGAAGAGGAGVAGVLGTEELAGSAGVDASAGTGGSSGAAPASAGASGAGAETAGGNNAGQGGAGVVDAGALPDDGRGPHAPVEGSIEVLYDGHGFANWEPLDRALSEVNWREDSVEGSMEVTPTYSNHIVTNAEQLHRDVFLHIEFRSPNEPGQTGQDRGNSGIYLQSRYEMQVLDSEGRPPEIDGCGAVYKVSLPLVNACKPAEEWNVYEIDFKAPRFEAGQKVANARITAWINDQLVQDDTEVPGPTQAGQAGEPDAPQPLYLQDHGDLVRYRNVWWIRL